MNKVFSRKSFILLTAVVLFASGFFVSLVPKAEAAAGPNTITKTDVTPGNQPGTFTGVPVYELHVTNASVDTPDTILRIYPTPSGSVVDTLVRLHFYYDSNDNGIVDAGESDLGASALFGSNDTGQWFDIGNLAVGAGGTSSILITADGTGLANGGTFLLSIASIANVDMQLVQITGAAPGANGGALTIDAVAPTVTAAVQSVTDALDQTVNVQSNEGTGNVYIILTGETQVTVADLNAAFLANKGVREAVITANTNVPLSTSGLTVGVYHAYAVDAAGNISTEGTNAITVAAAAPVFTPTINSTTENATSTLGLVGTSATSSDATVVTADLTSHAGYVTITSVASGTAVITLTAANGNQAIINVDVAANGSFQYGPVKWTAKTNSGTANTDEILGLVGTTAVSSNIAIATTSISGGNIAITSVGVGATTITVSDGINSATIPVAVDATGAITIGTITPYLSSDASLISVVEQSITATGTGTQGSPKIASISVANTVHAIYVEDVVAATSATPYLYSNSGFTTTAEPLNLVVGDTHAYIKVVVENGTDVYYDVTITRAAATTYAITDGTMTRLSGDDTSTVNIDATPVVAGETVTLTVAAKTGMRLEADTLAATYNGTQTATLTNTGTNTYTFTMPAYAVTVTATFEAIPVNITSFDAITDIAGGIAGSATYANAAAVIAALPDGAKDISWKAEKYTDPNKSCSERLKLTIKGKNFDKDAEVFIGGKEASAVNVKNSKELTAKFCLKKLLNDKVDQKRKITVKNPDTKKGEANKQIDLRDLTSGNEVAVANNTSAQSSSGGDYDQKTKEGAKQIQEALNKLGYLDAENITSTFGSITMEAVKKFQSDNGIDATGFVGELTRAKLAEKIR